MNERNVIGMSQWIVMQPNVRQAVAIPETILRDDKIRTAMEQSLIKTDQEILESSKLLHEQALIPLLKVTLRRPFLPPHISPNGLISNGTGNQDLKVFAYDVYEALDQYFGGQEWQSWFIAAYFDEVDDMQAAFHLGLFIGESFNKTVVE